MAERKAGKRFVREDDGRSIKRRHRMPPRSTELSAAMEPLASLLDPRSAAAWLGVSRRTAHHPRTEDARTRVKDGVLYVGIEYADVATDYQYDVGAIGHESHAAVWSLRRAVPPASLEGITKVVFMGTAEPNYGPVRSPEAKVLLDTWDDTESAAAHAADMQEYSTGRSASAAERHMIRSGWDLDAEKNEPFEAEAHMSSWVHGDKWVRVPVSISTSEASRREAFTKAYQDECRELQSGVCLTPFNIRPVTHKNITLTRDFPLGTDRDVVDTRARKVRYFGLVAFILRALAADIEVEVTHVLATDPVLDIVALAVDRHRAFGNPARFHVKCATRWSPEYCVASLWQFRATTARLPVDKWWFYNQFGAEFKGTIFGEQLSESEFDALCATRNDNTELFQLILAERTTSEVLSLEDIIFDVHPETFPFQIDFYVTHGLRVDSISHAAQRWINARRRAGPGSLIRLRILTLSPSLGGRLRLAGSRNPLRLCH